MRSSFLRFPTFAVAFLAALTVGACSPQTPEATVAVLTGDYLGQDPPGDTAEIFAPGFVNTGVYTRDVAMTPDGSEFYFGVLLGPVATIMETRRGPDGTWSEPQVAPFARDSRFFYLEPAIAPDGSRFMFLSTRVEGREPEAAELRTWSNQDIWVVDREGDHWSEPYGLGAPVNSEDSEFFPSLTRDGTLYFTRAPKDGQESYIYRARLGEDGRYGDPERLGQQVNSTPNQFNAFIAPDESYIIVCTGGREDTVGGTDYYVVFRSDDDRWSEPVNLGDVVNTPGSGEFSPYVSPDGKYLFFMSTRVKERDRIPDTLTWSYIQHFRTLPETGNAGIYWVDASFLEGLRPEGF